MADEWAEFYNNQFEVKKQQQQHPKSSIPAIPAIPAIPESMEDLHHFNTGASNDHDNGEFDGYSKSQNHRQSSAAPVYDQEEQAAEPAAAAIPVTKKPIQPKRAVEPAHVEVAATAAAPAAPKKRPIEAVAATTKPATAPAPAPAKIIPAAKEAEKTTVAPKPATAKPQAPKPATVVAPAPAIQKKIAPVVNQEVFDDDEDETEDVEDPMEVIEIPKKTIEKKQPVATPAKTTQPPKPQQYGMVPAPAPKTSAVPSKAPVAPAKPAIQPPRPQTPAAPKAASAVATQPKPPAVQPKAPVEPTRYKQLAAINRNIGREEDDDEDEQEDDEEEEEEEEKPIQPATKRAKMTVDEYALHEEQVKNIFRTVLTGMLMSLDATDEHTLAAAQQISSRLKSTMEANKTQANSSSKQRSKPKPMERKITEIQGPMMSVYQYNEEDVQSALELMQKKVLEIMGNHRPAEVVKITEKKLTGFFPNRGHINNPNLSELARGRYKTLCEFITRMYPNDVKEYTPAVKGISRIDIVAKYCRETPLDPNSTRVLAVFVDEHENYIDYFANGIAHVIASIHVKQEALELKQKEAAMQVQQEEQEEEGEQQQEEEEQQEHE